MLKFHRYVEKNPYNKNSEGEISVLVTYLKLEMSKASDLVFRKRLF